MKIATSPLKIVYDISSLGLGFSRPAFRTGIYRMVENVALGLKNSSCDLAFSASVDFPSQHHCQRYLNATPSFKKTPLLLSRVGSQVYHQVDNFFNHTHKPNSQSFSNKVMRRAKHFLETLLENHFSRVPDVSQYDIFHATFYQVPNNVRRLKNVKKFLTVYDLISILYPHLQKGEMVKEAIESISKGDFVLCDSHSTKNDLLNYRKDLCENHVFVTYPAASELFYPCEDKTLIKSTLKKYQIPDAPYFLSICTLEPRKNIPFVIKAFEKVINEVRSKDLVLVLAGSPLSGQNDLLNKINSSQAKKQILMPGYILDEDLAPLYSGAMAFLYPSLYEGFGLPPLEAMQCGIPVITSNTSSLPEVVGKAGITINPTSLDDLCHQMIELYQRSSLRACYREKSIERAKEFSWKRCTSETLSAYYRSLEE